MSWRQKLVRRVLPLWAAAVALSFAPHLCWDFDFSGAFDAAFAVIYLVLLLPSVALAYHLAAVRRWWAVLAGSGVMGVIGAGVVLNAEFTGDCGPTEELVGMPLFAVGVYLAAAARAVRDRSWDWRSATSALTPGWPFLVFASWAVLSWFVGRSVGALAMLGFVPSPSWREASWTALHVAGSGLLFQVSLRAAAGFGLRAALCTFSAVSMLAFMGEDLSLEGAALGPGMVIADAAVIGLFIFLMQDELRRLLPDVPWRERQKAFVGRVTVAASAASAVFLFAVGIWITTFGRPSLVSLVLVVPMAGAVITFLHFAVICRLRTLLVVKLSLSAITILAVVDAVLGVAFRVGDAHAVGFDHLGIAMAAERLLVGIASFGVAAWSIICTIAHFEDRDQPLDEDKDERPAG